MGNTLSNAACRPISSRFDSATSACKNRRYESNWIASRYGVPRMLGRLPKFLRMRFFSVNE